LKIIKEKKEKHKGVRKTASMRTESIGRGRSGKERGKEKG